MTKIYADTDVCRYHISQLRLEPSADINLELAVYHVPCPYYQNDAKIFESKINQSLQLSNKIAILCSELNEQSVDFIRRYQNPKIRFFLCGSIDGISSNDWMDWFVTSTYFYKNNAVLDQLTPFEIKSKTFDILLGLPRAHRDLIYEYITVNNFNNQVIMTYIDHLNKISDLRDHKGWIWEKEGVDLTGSHLKWSTSPITYYGYKMSLSQVVPINVYNNSAFSVVAETNFASDYVFHTEKIVKPIMARRLFLVFGGVNYLRNLKRLGFETFDNIIDESYDMEKDYQKRGRMICEQIDYLMRQDQRTILDKIKSIVQHNYDIMMTTDWNKNFIREFRWFLLDHEVQN